MIAARGAALRIAAPGRREHFRVQPNLKPSSRKQIATTSERLGHFLARATEPSRTFKTVLVPSCGWPTEVAAPKGRGRAVKR